MFGTLKVTLAAMVMGTALFAVGCQSSDDKHAGHQHDSSMTAAGEDQIVTCDKCKVTWRKVPHGDKGRVMSYTSAKSHECPDCRSIATNFFTTGNMEHTCKTCGEDAMQVCKAH